MKPKNDYNIQSAVDVYQRTWYIYADVPRRERRHRVPCMTYYCIRSSSEHVQRIQHDQDVVLVQGSVSIHASASSPKLLCTTAISMSDRRRLVRRSVPGFHVGRRQCGGRGRDIGHLSRRDVLTVILPIEYHPRLAPPLPRRSRKTLIPSK